MHVCFVLSMINYTYKLETFVNRHLHFGNNLESDIFSVFNNPPTILSPIVNQLSTSKESNCQPKESAYGSIQLFNHPFNVLNLPRQVEFRDMKEDIDLPFISPSFASPLDKPIIPSAIMWVLEMCMIWI